MQQIEAHIREVKRWFGPIGRRAVGLEVNITVHFSHSYTCNAADCADLDRKGGYYLIGAA